MLSRPTAQWVRQLDKPYNSRSRTDGRTDVLGATLTAPRTDGRITTCFAKRFIAIER